MTEGKKYRPVAIQQERLKKVAAAHRFTSRDGSIRVHRPLVREDIANAEPLIVPKLGEMIEGEGIFLGEWRTAGDLGKTFNVFAAPEDLATSDSKVIFSYNEMRAQLDGLKNWHGHDGTSYANDRALVKEISEGRYNGGWVVPPREFVSGHDIRDTLIREENLYNLRETSSLKGTFSRAASNTGSFYWTSSAAAGQEGYFSAVNLATGSERPFYENNTRLHCRPIRFSEVTP